MAHPYNALVAFRSWKVQDAIKGFNPEQIRAILGAFKKGYVQGVVAISEVKRNRK